VLDEAGDADARPPDAPIFFGGINTYLDASGGWASRIPGRLRRWFDARLLLRATARLSHLTSAGEVGRLSISMIEQAERAHGREIARLADWLETADRPDALCLSNSMLIGIGTAVARRLDVPLVCSLQGEDAFIDELPEPYGRRTWAAIAERCPQVARFVAPSRFYAALMAERLDLAPGRITTVHNGVAVESTVEHESPAGAAAGPATLGYLARLHPSKGLDRLVDAWTALKADPRWAPARLVIAGAQSAGDRRYVRQLERRLEEAGLSTSVSWRPNVSRAEKRAVLDEIDVLCVPTQIPEAFGLYAAEAWSQGVPVVVPRIGALPELCEATGGGWLYDPEQDGALVATLQQALDDPAEAHWRGERGRQAVVERFSDRRMAEAFAAVLEEVVAPRMQNQGPDETNANGAA
jgi:glycosyltransferase involved in cell wall biosynthesis